jgi:hypothetical protein
MYSNAKDQFNTDLNTSEKRAVLVCFHKLGIPVEVPVMGAFDSKDVKFLSKTIDETEIKAMVGQISKGHCDHLFFIDVDTYFSENKAIKAIRAIGVKFVSDVLMKCKYDSEKGIVVFPKNWNSIFSYGEYKMIMVFYITVSDPCFFDNQTGFPYNDKLEKLMQEVENGLWDRYLQWDYNAFRNVIAQNQVTDMIRQYIPMESQPRSQQCPTSQ